MHHKKKKVDSEGNLVNVFVAIAHSHEAVMCT